MVTQLVKNPPAMQETPVWFLGQEDPLEKGTATPSSILAWRIPQTVYSMGSQRVGHNQATSTFHYVRKNRNMKEHVQWHNEYFHEAIYRWKNTMHCEQVITVQTLPIVLFRKINLGLNLEVTRRSLLEVIKRKQSLKFRTFWETK